MLRARRLSLLWHALQLSPDGRVITLVGQPARDAGYTDDRVLSFDIDHLKKDEAVEEAHDHPSSNLAGLTPCYITDKGLQMLLEAGYPIAS
jgi:hypothetical protein